MTSITRRTALKAAPAVALTAAVPGMAANQGATIIDDPALAAIAEWQRTWYAAWGEQGTCTLSDSDDDPEREAASEAENDAHTAACETIATSIAGLAAQLRFALTVISNEDVNHPGYRRYEPCSEPTSYVFNGWSNDRDKALLLNMLAAAEALAHPV